MRWFHVKIDTAKGWLHGEAILDLTEQQLKERVLAPYQQGRPIVSRGRTMDLSDIRRITIHETTTPSEDLFPKVRAKRARQPFVLPLPDRWYIPDEGVDVTDTFINEPPGTQAQPADESTGPSEQEPNPRRVMVVYGRNLEVRDRAFAFLRLLGLCPIEWHEAVDATGETAPYIGQVLDAAFSMAQAVLVVLTPDDEARLRPALLSDRDPAYESDLTGQARPNVLFEAGMALARNPARTILVELGDLRPFSDISGRHVIRYDGSLQARKDLVQRLKTAGCLVAADAAEWQREGAFAVDPAIVSPAAPQGAGTPTVAAPPEASTLPQWARYALAANVGTGWFTMLLAGSTATIPPSSAHADAADYVVRQLAVPTDAVDRHSHNHGIDISFPNGSVPLEARVGFRVEELGIVYAQFRPPTGAVHLRWLLDKCGLAGDILASAHTARFIDMTAACRLFISLSNWPEEGVSLDGLFHARRLSSSSATCQGYTLQRSYVVDTPNVADWERCLGFGGEVLRDCGYVEFEEPLAAVRRYMCEG